MHTASVTTSCGGGGAAALLPVPSAPMGALLPLISASSSLELIEMMVPARCDERPSERMIGN